MKILYAVQATGNGHISRASEILPYLKKYGDVDVFLSGSNANLPVELPVKYKSTGISLFYKDGGGLDLLKIVKQLKPFQLLKQALSLPVEEYDLIINDFECIASIACRLKKIPSVQMGHQASFQYNNAPRPYSRSKIGEWVLKNYCRATAHIGFHFQPYHANILPPIIKESVRETQCTQPEVLIANQSAHITVYLPQYSCGELVKYFRSLSYIHVHLFSSEVKKPFTEDNITYYPLGKETFSLSLCSSIGLITAGGFETPAEALYLKKRMIIIPIKNQYEQECNAAALEKLGSLVLKDLRVDFGKTICEFFGIKPHQIQFTENDCGMQSYYATWTNEKIIDEAMKIALQYTNTAKKVANPDRSYDTPDPAATALIGDTNTNFPLASSAMSIIP